MSEAMLLSYDPVQHLLPQPTSHAAPATIALASPLLNGGNTLTAALTRRKSVREFAPTPLSLQQLSELLWAANGINRPETGGRTAPSAHGLNEIDIYVALPEGVYQYEPVAHRLRLKHAVDARNLTGYQDFVGKAPLDLVYVVNHARADQMPEAVRETFAGVAAGAISQNVSLYCARPSWVVWYVAGSIIAFWQKPCRSMKTKCRCWRRRSATRPPSDEV